MNCTDLHQWLDDGRPEHALPQMQSHIATCLSCDQQLRAAIELDQLLGIVVPATVRPGFNDSVMQRIHASDKLEAVVQIFAEPIVPLSLALAIVIAFQRRALAGIVMQLSTWHLAPPDVTLTMTFAIAPLLLALSWLLFRACERMTTARS
jgi:ABC-type enterochelin transport system permease subunit